MPVIPEYDPAVNWNHQYVTFMDTYKRWKPGDFCGKAMSGREEHRQLESFFSKENKSFDWNKYCYTLLRNKIGLYNKEQGEPMLWQEQKSKYPFRHMITLNLPNTRTLSDAVECASRFVVACKWIKYAEYVPEYHTATGGHPHVHILVMTDNKRYSIKSNVVNACVNNKNKKFAVAVLNQYLENTQSLKVTPYNENSISYIEGDKDVKKMEAVEADRLMRKSLDIEDKYIYNITI